MVRHGIGFGIGVLLLTTVAFSDEPASKSSSQKQRVSPKLLKEALALPEFAARTQEVPPVTIEDLRRLANKLKASGDVDDSELLQRFIVEHERISTRAHAYPGAQNEMFNIQCDVFEVKVDDLPSSCSVYDCHCASLSKELQAELHRLIKGKKAKTVIENVQIPLKAYETGHARSGGEFPVPIPSSDGKVAVEFRKIGTVVEASATPLTKSRVQIQVVTETATKDPELATTIRGTSVPGVTTRKVQSTIEADLGETVVQVSKASGNGDFQFVLVKVTSRN